MKKNRKTRRARGTWLVFLFLLFPALSWAQEKMVSLRIKDVSVEQAIQQLRETTEYKFLFNHEEIINAGKKTLDLKDVPLTKVMDSLLQGTGLTYRIEKDVVVIVPIRKKGGSVKKITISGSVLDETQQPLPGVAVVYSSTHQGTATGGDGKFSLEIPDDEHGVLVFSMLGMKKKEVIVGKKRVFNIILEEDLVQLGDVIVTGYQTISKERSAGSFSVVDGNDVANKAGLSGNIIESMEGLTTGLSVNFGDGQEKYLIRGTTSINSTQSPLFVLDGVPISSSSFEELVNSNDIESITFLKDATAASIWGAQAANGVVVVTTKQGKNTDKKIKISYSGSYTYKGLPDYDYMQYMSSRMFIKNAKEIFSPEFYTWNSITTTSNGIGGNIPIVYPHEQIMYNQDLSDSQRDEALQQLASRNNRKQVEKYFMTPAFFTTHSLSFSGGGEKHRYYGSLGYEHNTSSSKDVTDKYQLNLKQDFTFTEWLQMDLGINMAILDVDNAIAPYMTDLNSIFPYQMFADKDGNPLSHADLLYYEPDRLEFERKSQKDLNFIPLTDNKDGFNTAFNFNARVNAGISIKLYRGLSYNGRFQYQRGNNETEVFYDQNSQRVKEELIKYSSFDEKTGTPVYYLPNTGGYYNTTHVTTTDWTIRNQLAFDRVFENSDSQVTALFGMEVRSNKTRNQSTIRRGYNPQTMISGSYDELWLSVTGVANPIYPSSSGNSKLSGMGVRFSEVEKRFVSVYANAAYTWRGKYSLNGSIRVDQSNLFGSDPSVQFKPIWSVGGAWSLGQEEFMQKVDMLNRLNVRLSYGLGGNSPDPGLGGPYDILYPVTNNAFASLGQGYVVITPANDKLTWEKTRIINVGVDFALFNQRLAGSIDVYSKKTTDLLGQVPLHPATGWEKSLANLGTMKNSGFELSLNSLNINGKGLKWRTDFTLTYNKNKITKLYVNDGLSANSIITKNFVEGYAAQTLFAYRWAGLDELGDPQVYNEKGEKVKLSKDIQDVKAVKAAGTMQPLWYGGLTNVLTYNNFEVSFMFVYNLGHKMRNDKNTFYSGRLTGNIHKDFDKRWRQEGDEKYTNIPSYVANGKESVVRREIDFYNYADVNIENASYVKLRDLSFSYALPRQICDKLAADNIKVRFQMANLFYFAANKQGIDPEAFNLKYGRRTTAYGPSYSVGLTVNFK